jgi:rhodanese-related sulfurtransferase
MSMLNRYYNEMINISFSIILILLLYGCQNDHPQKKGNENALIRVEKKEGIQIDSLPEIIVIDGANKNLGDVKEGVKVSTIFTVKNIGNAIAKDISFHDLSRGGCTSVSKISELAIGDSAKLEFIFETLGYGGKEQRRQVQVRYNNPENSPITLSVTAKVIPTESYQVPIGELLYNFFVLVDVRNKSKFRAGHIIGAINVPAEDLVSWASQIPKTFMIYIYSDDGNLSDQCAKILREEGYSRTLSIVGGLTEWKSQYGERFIITGDK